MVIEDQGFYNAKNDGHTRVPLLVAQTFVRAASPNMSL